MKSLLIPKKAQSSVFLTIRLLKREHRLSFSCLDRGWCQAKVSALSNSNSKVWTYWSHCKRIGFILIFHILLIKFILTYIPDLDPLKIEAVQQKTCQFENKVAYSSTNISIKSNGSKSCYSSTIPKQTNQSSALISPKTLNKYKNLSTEIKLNDGLNEKKDSKGSSTSIGIISPLKSPSKEKRSSLTVQQALKKSVNKLKRLDSTPLKNISHSVNSPLGSPNIGEQLDEDIRTFEEKYTIIDSEMLGEGCSSTVKECIPNL